MSFQLVLQLVDSVAESLEVTHVKYLTTNVEVKPKELNVLHFCSFLDDALHIAHSDTKLVFCQAGCDVGMSMSAHIRVDAEANLSYLILFSCKFIDNLKFWDALYIEAEDAFLQTEIDFPITLAYTCIYNLAGRETCLDGCLNLSSAHAVGSQSCLTDDIEHLWIGVCLHGIMYLKSLMFACLFINRLQSLAQQIGVIIVEWSLYLLKFVNRKCSFHFA